MEDDFISSGRCVDLEPLAALDFGSVVSWAHLELYATVAGLDLDERVACAVLVGSRWFKNVYDAILSEMLSPGWNAGLSGQEFMDTLFMTYDDTKAGYKFSKGRSPAAEAWFEFSRRHIRSEFVTPPDDEIRLRKYRMLHALAASCPVTLARFYERRKADLHRIDAPFVSWLARNFSSLAVSKGGVYAKIAPALMSEISRQNTTGMFLN